MNDELYDEILNNGLGLNSPSLDLASKTITILNQANESVDSLPVSEIPGDKLVPEELIEETHNAINGAVDGVTSSQIHMQSQLDSIFAIINDSASVNRIEDVDGCAYLTEATGSVLGEVDTFLQEIVKVALKQMGAITAYLAAQIDVDQLTTLLQGLNSSYDEFENAMAKLISDEVALINELRNKLESSSLAQSLELLWSDPCAQAVLDQTLSPELKDILNGQ